MLASLLIRPAVLTALTLDDEPLSKEEQISYWIAKLKEDTANPVGKHWAARALGSFALRLNRRYRKYCVSE
jgi:hypothetical protein